MLKEMDPHLYGHDGVFPDAPLYYPYLAPGNWSNVVGLTYVPDYDIPLKTPFALWVVGAACSYLFLVGVLLSFVWTTKPRCLATFLEQHQRSKGAFVLLLNFVPFIFYFIAIGMFTTATMKFMLIVNDAKTESANNVYLGSGFLALAWVTVLIQSVAGVSAYQYWRVICRKWQDDIDERRRLEHEFQEFT
jgi:hypothetical protein